ncbi:MAG: hypothetical protein FJY29_11410 [Betaproteobacteria bacterium]|nr:hypothetical protein [Betaproteobacteria bacterium]
MSDQNTNTERWMVATAAALRALTAYFPVGEVLNSAVSAAPGRLLPQFFPCQKSVDKPCQGWTFASTKTGLGAQGAMLCPCARGQSAALLPLLELAEEFSGEFNLPAQSARPKKRTFTLAAERAEVLLQILGWMHWAAKMGFPPRQETAWVEEFVELPLETQQRQALRWWIRLVELNQLINNEVFTLLTRRSLQELYKRGQMIAIAHTFEQLSICDTSLVVLCLTGDALKPTGQHSQALAWFESFLSCMDDSRAGLCLIAAQPLLDDVSSEDSFSQDMSRDYRWRVRRHSAERSQSLERVLRRGSWDRLLEALARGDHLLRARVQS